MSAGPTTRMDLSTREASDDHKQALLSELAMVFFVSFKHSLIIHARFAGFSAASVAGWSVGIFPLVGGMVCFTPACYHQRGEKLKSISDSPGGLAVGPVKLVPFWRRPLPQSGVFIGTCNGSPFPLSCDCM